MVESEGALNLTKTWLAWAQQLAPPLERWSSASLLVSRTISSTISRSASSPEALFSRARKGSYLARRSDWRRSWTKPIHNRFTRNNSMAPRLEQRKARCQLLALPQDRCSRDAHSSVVLGRRSHPNAHAASKLVKVNSTNAGWNYSIHHSGRSATILRSRHERSTQQNRP
jgi:hypothetical protein